MIGPVARLVGIALAVSCATEALAATGRPTTGRPAAGSPAPGNPAPARYEDGLAAYQRNDFERSFKTMRPLAERGDTRAQYMLGRHYQFGQGTKADKAEAYFWYRRAEARGNLEAKLFRQLLEIRWKLPAADKAQAERRLAALNAPKAAPEKPRQAARAPAKPRAETPRDTAAARRPESTTPAARIAETRAPDQSIPDRTSPGRPAITGRPTLPPSFDAARATPDRTVERRPAERFPAEKTAPERPALEKPAMAAVRSTPSVPPPETETRLSRDGLSPDRRSVQPPTDRHASSRAPATERPFEHLDREIEPPAYRHRDLPAETRADLSQGELDYRAEAAQPRYDAPQDDVPHHSTPNNAYQPAPRYHAPGAAPNWRPSPYYAPRYAPPAAPAWAYRAPRGYMHPGWRAPPVAWRPYPGWRRYPGY